MYHSEFGVTNNRIHSSQLRQTETFLKDIRSQYWVGQQSWEMIPPPVVAHGQSWEPLPRLHLKASVCLSPSLETLLRMPSCSPDSLLNQSYLFDWQGLGHILALAARETQKVTSDLYFEEVELIRSEIPPKSETCSKGTD